MAIGAIMKQIEAALALINWYRDNASPQPPTSLEKKFHAALTAAAEAAETTGEPRDATASCLVPRQNSGKPTQAQIEAAAAEIEKYRGLNQTAETLAKAALTAAAEVCPQCGNDKSQHKMDCTWPTVYDTAAAEAGDDWVREIDRKGAELAAAHIKDTIERCAQVVKECEKGSGRDLSDVIAAIRAMKDQKNVR